MYLKSKSYENFVNKMMKTRNDEMIFSKNETAPSGRGSDYWLTNRFHVAVRLFSSRSQMTSNCGKNKKDQLFAEAEG